MNTSVSTRTIWCTVQRAHAAAATYCAQVAWEQQITNTNKLHHVVYGPTRAQFGLGAHLACCARDTAAEAVRATRAKDGDMPTFSERSSIRDDARTYRLMRLDRVRLHTISGRVIGQLLLGDVQRRTLYDTRGTIGGAELVRRANVWYLHITQTKVNPAPDEPTGTIGVDLGIVNRATDSDGDSYSGAQIRQVRDRRVPHRRRLQQANTRRARWRLRQRAGKEVRFQNHTNHGISKRLVPKAKQERKARAREDLTGLRVRITVRRSERRQHARWAFNQVRQLVTYKAQRDGVRVVLVNPAYTSRTGRACLRGPQRLHRNA